MPLKSFAFALTLAIGPIAIAQEPSRVVETWVVHTRACEQVDGVEAPGPASRSAGSTSRPGGPAPRHRTRRAPDPSLGGPTHRHPEPRQWITTISTVAQGSAPDPRPSSRRLGGLARRETLFVVFDWPSERTLRVAGPWTSTRRRGDPGSRAITSLGSSRSSPAGSTICLMGQSDGGRVTLTTLHLLSGAELRLGSCPSRPGQARPRAGPTSGSAAVVLEAAVGHQLAQPRPSGWKAGPSHDARRC